MGKHACAPACASACGCGPATGKQATGRRVVLKRVVRRKPAVASLEAAAAATVATATVPATSAAGVAAPGRPSHPLLAYEGIFSPASAEETAALIRDTDELFVSISFFLKAGATPRTAHERLARQVWEKYTKGLVPGRDYNPKKSGVEWWVQKRRREPGAGYEEIAFHWDKDEDAVDRKNINVNPWVATVTYLTGHGPPTVILDHTTPREYGKMTCGSVGACHVSYPSVGKHVAFDGRWLHGVPPALAADPPAEEGAEPLTRLTFLANIWLDHVPLGVDRLPKAAVEELKLLADGAGPTFKPAAEWVEAGAASRAEVAALGEGRESARCGMGPTGKEFALVLRLDEEGVRQARREGGAHMVSVPSGAGEVLAQEVVASEGEGVEEEEEEEEVVVKVAKKVATKKKKTTTTTKKGVAVKKVKRK